MKPSQVVAAVIVLVTLVGGAVFWLTRPPKASPNVDAFARCLAEKQVTMYGAYWCSHCQAEKKGFGSSFQYVPYVECTVDVKKCTDANIQSYPTWIFPDGKRLVGVQGLEKLSSESACPLTR